MEESCSDEMYERLAFTVAIFFLVVLALLIVLGVLGVL